MQHLSPEQFARLLQTSLFSDGVTRVVRPGGDGTISVNIVDLTAQEQGLARNALAEIARMTGLRFVETTGRASITYLNDGDRAHTQSSASGSTISSSTIRIASERVGAGDGYGSFAFRTYMHETLHALGLGHPQDYGRVRDFSQSEIANDSWQMSILSYFDQDENTAIDATKAYNLTPMLADYLALSAMYGVTTMHMGATTYGVGSNAGGSLDQLASLGARAAFLLVDDGGIDHVNFSNTSAAQRIDLGPGAFSNVLGAIGNMHIAPGTVVENATGGGGADVILGNHVGNRLAGGDGNDLLEGRAGADALDGQGGDDRLSGGDGDDRMSGGSGNDQLRGGAGNDRLTDVSGTNLLDGEGGNDAITGGSGADTAIGGAGSDTLVGAGGNDNLSGGDGGDRLFGGEGGDVMRGGVGHDILIGGAGDDRLYGDAGNDDLAAEGGRDLLDGGAGDDLLRGGIGADRFVFAAGHDRIRNFDRSVDVIDLSGFAGLDRWADVSARLTQSGNHTLFQMNGHSLVIEWTRANTLDHTDFVW